MAGLVEEVQQPAVVGKVVQVRAQVAVGRGRGHRVGAYRRETRVEQGTGTKTRVHTIHRCRLSIREWSGRLEVRRRRCQLVLALGDGVRPCRSGFSRELLRSEAPTSDLQSLMRIS